jgi:hypothetical protein
MRDSRSPERGPVSSRSAHLTEWTLEQLAEGTLSERDEAEALGHVEACGRCSAELDGFRALFAALEGLPRFAPSAGFGDAVMARVRVAPRANPAVERVRRWLPKTRRGWMMLAVALVAPALPVLGLAIWMLTHPLFSPMALWQWTSLQVQEGTRTTFAYLMGWGSATGVFERTEQVYSTVTATPLLTLGVVVGVLAVAIPLSAWSLVRLTRTPMGTATYAN